MARCGFPGHDSEILRPGSDGRSTDVADSPRASLAGMLAAGCSVGSCESGDAKVWSSSAECAPRDLLLAKVRKWQHRARSEGGDTSNKLVGLCKQPSSGRSPWKEARPRLRIARVEQFYPVKRMIRGIGDASSSTYSQTLNG